MKLRSGGSLLGSRTSLLLKESEVFEGKTSKSLSESDFLGLWTHRGPLCDFSVFPKKALPEREPF